jgi:anti-sigma-K factor RskA
VRPFRHDPHDLTGVYAIDAIDDTTEHARFEHHLRHCQQCASEVRGLSDTTTRMAFAATQPPPPQMRERVLAAISRTRQLPPSVEHHRLRARPSWVRPQLAWVAAAACLVLVVALTVGLVQAERQLHQATTRETALAAVLAAPDAHAVTRTTSAGGTATVVFSRTRHALIVTSAGLPALPAGKVYQLWLLGPPQVRSAGLLPEGQNGRSAPVYVPGLVSGDQVGLTVEPAPGTSKPTTTPILVLSLPA